MNLNDIKMLIQAGYTKEEIQALEAPAPAPVTEPIEAAEPSPAAPEEIPAAEAPAPEEQPMDQTLLMLQQMIQQNQQMLQAIQAANIQAARMPADTKETPEDLIAKIIAPGPKAEKGGK